ncbi:MAG: hypothetical protein AAF378_22800 [Cyanobacteria bacterium P01_A01_bin.84]
MSLIFESRHKPSMRIFFKILSIFYLYGAIVHYANLLGFGEIPFTEEPLSWQIADIFYAILDTLTVIGLWLNTRWGIVGFLIGITSQLILYIGFPHWFAFTPEHLQLLWSMVIFHVVTLSIFFSLLLFAPKAIEEVN